MTNKVILTAAITGSVHVPSMSDYLPITPQQIIDDAVAAAEAGASVVHIHAREEKDGRPTNDVEKVSEIYEAIKEKTNAIICVTTGGSITMTADERLGAVKAIKPELASCNAGSINFTFSDIAKGIENPKYDWEIPYVENSAKINFSNTFESMETYIKTMQANGTTPEFEVYDVGMINNLSYLIKKGVLKQPIYIQFVMGILGGIPANIDNLIYLYNTACKQLGKENFVWSVAAAGRFQFDVVTTGMLLGGNVRVGLEDNLYLSKGVLAKSNAEAVNKMKGIIEAHERQVATPDEARKILKLIK